MLDKVELKKVWRADNWEAVVDLATRCRPEYLVESNLYSVAEAQFNPDGRRAVYAGKRVVGFLMSRRAENERQVAESLESIASLSIGSTKAKAMVTRH